MKSNKIKDFFKYKVSYFFGHTIWTPFIVIKNWLLCLRYPFWRARNVWSDKPAGYTWTRYDSIPEGWQKSIGKQLSKELKASFKSKEEMNEFRFTDIKEKWGGLCLYNFGASDETSNIITKYELMSLGYCIFCGKPARYITSGYILFVCENCFAKRICINMSKDEIEAAKKKHRLTLEDVPKMSSYKDDKSHEIDVKETYGVDFNKLWGLSEDDKK